MAGTTFGKKEIWTVFFILLAVTILEFVIAFTVGNKPVKNITFVILTIVKAYYIMAYFMHLKFEWKSFINSVVMPFLFIIVLLVALVYEGATINLWTFLK